MTVQERLGFEKKPVFLMDGTAFVYRSYYAQRHLARADGFPTNAITLLARVLLRILRQEEPEYFLFVMDGPGPNFRKDLYAAYKANREAMPEALVLQLEPVRRLIPCLGLALHVTRGCEADDCIASLAARFSPQRPVVIISGDKDLKQCLGPQVVMWDPGGKEEKLLTAQGFEEAEGLAPAQWADVQALIGDNSDNIPGVPGIGPKTAKQIFGQFANLESLQAKMESLPEKWRAKLMPHMEDAFLWRQLTTLRRDACGELTLADLAVRPIDGEAGEAFAKEFELTAIGRELRTLAKRQQQGELDVLTRVSAQSPPLPVAQNEPPLTEISMIPPCVGKTVALVWPEGIDAPWQVSMEGQEEEWRVAEEGLCSWVRDAQWIVVPEYRLLLVSDRTYCWEAMGEKMVDLSLSSWLLDPDFGDYALAVVIRRWAQKSQGGLASLALAAGMALVKALHERELMDLYTALELPLAPVLAGMQHTGIAIDPVAFRAFLGDVQQDLDNLTREIFEGAGGEFKIRSTRQLGEVLFGRLGMTPTRLTATGQPATDQVALEKLAVEHPLVMRILEYRRLDKMRSTYLEPLPKLMDAHHRLHSSFNQTATATGRISSSDPNLQNIPIRGQLGQRMRGCFVPGDGLVLVGADYSQIELRVLAHLSGDEHLLAAFRHGEDIHSRTAALIFDVDASNLSGDQRRMAKTINFGLLYGMGAQKLAQELKISLPRAKEFMERYFARLAGLRDFYEQVKANARRDGYVRTMAGRKRWLPDINSRNGQAKAQAERQAINTVIQGSAADIMKLAMLAVARDAFLRAAQAHMVLQVHDEVLLESPRAVAQDVGSRVAAILESVRPGGQELQVPLKVDWGVGRNWAEVH